MTFKHGKFSESVVMRSLEKVAREKGLVKEEDFVKTATVTKRANLNPSSDPLVSLMRLGEGLREAGYEKLAVEIEDKALAFKQAQTLYETSKETGEDLIDFAHPKGSHKLEGVDGTEAVIETILDQHLKSVKMVEKKPTGKLASHRDILNAVKKVLGQEVPDLSVSEEKMRSSLREAVRIMRFIISKSGEELPAFSWALNVNDKMLDEGKTITSSQIDNLKAKISDLKDELEPGIFSGISQDKWKQISGLFESVEKQINLANAGLAEYNKNSAIKNQLEMGGSDVSQPSSVRKMETFVDSDFDRAIASLKGLIGKLNTWKAFRIISSQPAAVKWIDAEIKDLQSIYNNYGKLPDDQHDNALKQLNKEIADEKLVISKFEQDWIA